MSYLTLSASFEYLFYGSMIFVNILPLQCGDRLKSIPVLKGLTHVCFRNVIMSRLDLHSTKLLAFS